MDISGVTVSVTTEMPPMFRHQTPNTKHDEAEKPSNLSHEPYPTAPVLLVLARPMVLREMPRAPAEPQSLIRPYEAIPRVKTS